MFEDVDGPKQKTLIRLLILIGIGLPILIEVATFGSLLSHHFVGGAGDGGAAATPTPEIEGAGVGDEILAETNQTERIERASVVTADDGWRFTLTVNVTNTGRTPTEVRLGAVTTRGGATVDGSATTGRVSPGSSVSVTGGWLLPAGERPDTVAVTVVSYPSDGTATIEQYTVRLGDIPVSNR